MAGRRRTLVLSAALLACAGFAPLALSDGPGTARVYGYAVERILPHDPTSFTEGLAYHDGSMIESSGLSTRSFLRRTTVRGRIMRQVAVPRAWAEGATVLGRRVFQLTYTEHKALVYDVRTFKLLRTLHYAGEGWGLASDGSRLIMSNGSAVLTFRDPSNFAARGTLPVVDGGQPVSGLNELEVVRGAICANVYPTDRIACIDARSGRVRYWIDLTGLLPSRLRSDEQADLNGIAYDAKRSRLFVTGKFWPRLYQIRRAPLPG